METWHEYTLDSFVYVDPKNQPRKKKKQKQNRGTNCGPQYIHSLNTIPEN
jgi:hypothetical protein